MLGIRRRKLVDHHDASKAGLLREPPIDATNPYLDNTVTTPSARAGA
jgi:hypothetical protein